MSKNVRLAVGIGLGVVAISWFAHDVPWDELKERLRHVHLAWVAAAVAIMLVGEFVIRAFRWRVLLRPLGTTARVSDLFAAVVIGAAANTLLPFRAGEVAKALVATRRTGYPLAAVVATWVMERVYDLFGVVSVLIAMVLVLPKAGSAEGELVENLKLYGGILGFVALTCMAIFFALATRPISARAIFARIVSVAPRPVAHRFLDLFDGFVLGLGNTRDWKGLLEAGALTELMWFSLTGTIYCLFQAFDMGLPAGAACFTTVAVALAVVLPQAPGFIGVFHMAMEKTMVLWGQDPASAKGFAIVFWAVSFLPVTCIGLWAMGREGLSMRQIQVGPDPLSPAGQDTSAPVAP